MQAILSNNIGKEIQDALGLKDATDIKIHLHVGEMVTVEVTYFPDKDDMQKLIPIMAKYYLVERPVIVDVTTLENEYNEYRKS